MTCGVLLLVVVGTFFCFFFGAVALVARFDCFFFVATVLLARFCFLLFFVAVFDFDFFAIGAPPPIE